VEIRYITLLPLVVLLPALTDWLAWDLTTHSTYFNLRLPDIRECRQLAKCWFESWSFDRKAEFMILNPTLKPTFTISFYRFRRPAVIQRFKTPLTDRLVPTVLISRQRADSDCSSHDRNVRQRCVGECGSKGAQSYISLNNSLVRSIPWPNRSIFDLIARCAY
jgi:hypothetical protein